MTNDNVIVYDLETQKTFAEVGGANNMDKLGISYLGIYSYAQGEYYGFKEEGLPKLEAIMSRERPTIVGFNSIHFDNTVLQPYFRQLDISSLPQVDILADINDTLGFRMKLESVAQATLGEGKSGSGLDAIRYYRESNWDALSKYCMDDVRITKEIYDFGKAHGFILYSSGGSIMRMPVEWSQELKITDYLQQAHKDHKRIRVNYLHITDDIKEKFDTDLDIISLDEDIVEVFCHHTNTKQAYKVQRILSIEMTNDTYAYQATLF